MADRDTLCRHTSDGQERNTPQGMIRGYHRDEELPFKKGDRVRILKGTQIRSTNPSRHEWCASRTYSVKIHHFGCGQSMSVGHQFAGGERQGYFTHKNDVIIAKEIFGTDDPTALVNHPDAIVTECGTVILPLNNPTIIWPGTGGYWCEVDINDVVKANP